MSMRPLFHGRGLLVLSWCFLAAIVGAAPAKDVVRSIPGYPALSSAMYAGYLNATGGRRAYYVLVESQSRPATDPLVLWLNGGPGCSSLMGLFEENGPVTMRLGGKLEANPYAWNTVANVLYIESPGGVGFSTDTVPSTTWNDAETQAFNLAALQSFYVKFPEYGGDHALYLAGESYAGFYIPELAYAIYRSEDAALQGRMRGFMVGNPCTGEFGCENPDPFLNPYLQYNGFAPMRAGLPTDNVTQDFFDQTDLLVSSCNDMAIPLRSRFLSHPVLRGLEARRRSGWAKRKPSSATAAPLGSSGPAPAFGPCADNYVIAWLNRPDVQQALHADPVEWMACNFSNSFRYTLNLDGVVPLYRELFDKTDWAIMFYSGLDDSIVNQAQTQSIVSNFGRPLAGTKQFEAWYRPDVYNASETQLGGFYVQYDRVSWAGVRDAGHMVPQYNPPSGLEIFRSFLALGRPGRLSDN